MYSEYDELQEWRDTLSAVELLVEERAKIDSELLVARTVALLEMILAHQIKTIGVLKEINEIVALSSLPG